MKRETENKVVWLILILSLIAVLVISVVKPAQAAGWSGSQTVTVEPDATIYTACFEYDFTDDWVINFTYDWHSLNGPAYDLSTTVYIPFNQHIYTTAGLRIPGAEAAKQYIIPYLSATYRF